MLVDTTEANIICLVRGKNEQDASERFWSVYKESFGIGHEERIRVICGDLSDEYLFKGKAIQQSLEKVNAVYYAAGSLTFVGSPDLEKHINLRVPGIYLIGWLKIKYPISIIFQL